MNTEINNLAERFAFIADGEYGLKNSVRNGHDGIAVLFHAGGYTEFSNDGQITAVVDNDERTLVWQVMPSVPEMRSTLDRFCLFTKE